MRARRPWDASTLFPLKAWGPLSASTSSTRHPLGASTSSTSAAGAHAHVSSWRGLATRANGALMDSFCLLLRRCSSFRPRVGQQSTVNLMKSPRSFCTWSPLPSTVSVSLTPSCDAGSAQRPLGGAHASYILALQRGHGCTAAVLVGSGSSPLRPPAVSRPVMIETINK